MKILLKIVILLTLAVITGYTNVDCMRRTRRPVLNFDTIAPHQAVLVRDRVAKLINVLHFKKVSESIVHGRTRNAMTGLEDNFDGANAGALYKALFASETRDYPTLASRIIETPRTHANSVKKLVTRNLTTTRSVQVFLWT
jgi:hypothetical protein